MAVNSSFVFQLYYLFSVHELHPAVVTFAKVTTTIAVAARASAEEIDESVRTATLQSTNTVTLITFEHPCVMCIANQQKIKTKTAEAT